MPRLYFGLNEMFVSHQGEAHAVPQFRRHAPAAARVDHDAPKNGLCRLRTALQATLQRIQQAYLGTCERALVV
jgi:hypothetical protein